MGSKRNVHVDCGRPWVEHAIAKIAAGLRWVCPGVAAQAQTDQERGE